MSRLTAVPGRLIEVRRYINVPIRWCEQHPARERWELWIHTTGGRDLQLIVHTRVMPARRGHRVTAVLHGERLLGLSNLSTGKCVNFVRSDPPLLWRRCDVARLAAVAAVTLAMALTDHPATALAGLAAATVWVPLLVGTRLIVRILLAQRVERVLDMTREQVGGGGVLPGG